jgi:uncharacterized protein (DUF58 family)
MDQMSQKKDTRSLLQKVRKIEIKTKGLTEQIFSGDYQSAFKGQGMSFSEVREYQYGDDVRSIDWNVTARTGVPHIKIFEEERQLTVLLMVDISPSVFTGTHKSNHELIAELSAILAFSAIQNNDKVGLLLFAEEIELFIPPAKGKKHILRIIREILYREASSEKTDVGNALQYLNNILHKRSIVFLMSDFFSKDFTKPLNVVSRKHDLIGLHIRNSFEKQIPFKGIYQLRDAESGQQIEIDLSHKKQRQQWLDHFDQHEDKCKSLFKKQQSELITLFTNEPYVKILHQFFSHRRK